MRHMIIGLGVAAISAAEAIRKYDAGAEIIVISDDPHGYYSRPGLAYYLTGEVPDKHLFPYPPQAYQALNARFKRGRVTLILPDEHSVEIDGKTRQAYDRLLIATGASAIRLNMPGAELQGVVKLDDLDDARSIMKLVRGTRTAVVVGGGITALEMVEGLLAQRVKVHLFLRGDRYWGNVLDEVESRLIEHRLKEEGVQIHYQTELAAITGKNGKVSAVRTSAGKEIRCEMLAVAIGVSPRIALARNAGIACEKGILVNEFMQTNLADIYAAGDVAQAYDPTAGRHVIDSLWSPARDQGYTAGLNMAGHQTKYTRHTPFNVTRLAGLTTTIIGAVGGGRNDDVAGIARGDSETWRTIPDAIITQSGFDVNHLRLMIGSDAILGAIVMGDQKLSSPLQALIRDRVNISPIRAQLLSPNAPIADIIADFWSSSQNNI